jgi:rRNA-processing protein FCF1
LPRTRADTLDAHLESNVLILDTSFALQSGFGNFAAQYADVFCKNRILVPAVVLEELDGLASASQDTAIRLAAAKAKGVLERLFRGDMAELRREKGDKVAHEVIQRVVEQHSATKNIVVLSNSASLERELKIRTEKLSPRKATTLVVALDPGTQLPVLRASVRQQSESRRERSRDPRSTPSPANAFRQATRPVVDERLLKASETLSRGSRVWLSDQRTLVLGDLVAEGGEGVIYTVPGQSVVCKIYRSDKLVHGKRDKITLMLSRSVTYPGICWPTMSVTDATGVFRGYLMPRAQGKPLAHTLFLPKQFLQERPTWTRRESVQLVLTILKCFEFLHGLNVLVGDVNPQNILLSTASNVAIVDCDSFQVEGSPCPVGTVNFSAPEIQGQDFRTFLRTKEHELFAVATLLFMIMFPGKSPYSHLGGEDGATNIRNGDFPYTRDRERSSKRAPRGVWTSCWSHLTPQIKDAFTHSFERSHFGQPRISVDKWIQLFSTYAQILSDGTKTFMGPRPQVGFDLSIMPHSRRYTEETADSLPADGRSDYDRLLDAMARKATPRREPPRRSTTTARAGGTRQVPPRIPVRTHVPAAKPQSSIPPASSSPGCALVMAVWVGVALTLAAALVLTI